MKSYKRNNKIISYLLLFTLIISFISTSVIQNVQAGSGSGSGKPPTESGTGVWWHVQGRKGTRDAWDQFMDYNRPYDNESSMTQKLNSLPNSQGFGGKNLAEACKESEFIWWFGSYGHWTGTGKNPSGTTWTKHYKPGYIYQEAGYTHNLYKAGTRDTLESIESFEKYKKSPHGRANWGKSPGVVIVCSATYEEEKTPIVLQANSGTFEYNENYHTVKGYTHKEGKLKPGHRIDASARRSEREPGVYDVDFTRKNIVDSSGKNVNNEYSKIEGLKGKLIIWNKPPESQDGPLWQCVDYQTESVTAYTKNGTSGSHVYSPGGRMSNDSKEVNTPAGDHAQEGRTLPVYGDSISAWNSWKSTFINGSKTDMTPELNLDGMGVSSILSHHGGVYEITKTLTKDTYTATHCQPQTREKIEKCDTFYRSDGSKYRKCWTELTPWKDDGPRMIDSTSGPRREFEYSSYQLLAVNCNESGFNRVRNQVGGTVITNGKGSGMLKTPTIPGRNAGRLGKGSHETARAGFYTDGTSCQEVYNCIVDRQPEANNDSDNNLNENPLFTQEVETDKHNKVNEDNQLVFFRDNNDRTVRADVWYVRNTGQSDLTSYPKDPAKQTYVNLYGGTPELQITTIHPLGMESDYFTRLGTERWNKHINKFNVRSQWASDEGKPYRLGVNWKYDARWDNSVPGRVNGDNVLSNVSNSGRFDAYCEFKNTKGTYPANIPRTPHANGHSNSPQWDASHALRVIFSRAVTNHKSR